VAALGEGKEAVPVRVGQTGEAPVGAVTGCSRWLPWLVAPGERRRLRSKRVGSVVDRAVGRMVGCSEREQMYGAGWRWIRHSTTPYGDGWEEISIKDDTWDIKGMWG